MADQIDPQQILDQCSGAIQRREINALDTLIESHPSVLVQFDNIPFVQTPLHVAASAGEAPLVAKIMTFKPSLARKLNQRGFTPLHLALVKLLPDRNQPTGAEPTPPDPTQPTHINPHDALEILTQPDPNQPTQPIDALQQTQSDPNQQTQSDPTQQTQTNSDSDLPASLRKVVHCLLSFDKDLVREKGKDGLTSLHYAAQLGDLDILIKFLITCPKSIIDVTARNETALHIALKQGRLEAFVLLNKWLHKASFEDAILWTKTLERWMDDERKTFSAIAKGKDLSQVDHKRIRRVLMGDRSLRASLIRVEDETRRVLLTIAALLITLTFQATINPPGGTWKDDYTCNSTQSCAIRPSHRAGTAVMSGDNFVVIAFFTALSLLYSFTAVILLLPRSPITLYCVVPVFLVCIYFIASFSILAPGSFPRVASYLLGVVLICFLMLAFFTLRRQRHRGTGN